MGSPEQEPAIQKSGQKRSTRRIPNTIRRLGAVALQRCTGQHHPGNGSCLTWQAAQPRSLSLPVLILDEYFSKWPNILLRGV